MDKTFADCLKPIIGGCGTPPNFAEKTFADGLQTSKSAKVFSLESFPLYSRHLHYLPTQFFVCCVYLLFFYYYSILFSVDSEREAKDWVLLTERH